MYTLCTIQGPTLEGSSVLQWWLPAWLVRADAPPSSPYDGRHMPQLNGTQVRIPDPLMLSWTMCPPAYGPKDTAASPARSYCLVPDSGQASVYWPRNPRSAYAQIGQWPDSNARPQIPGSVTGAREPKCLGILGSKPHPGRKSMGLDHTTSGSRIRPHAARALGTQVGSRASR